MSTYVPPIKIQGIKTKLVPIIIENIKIDDKTIWVEPFMGSGVVGFNVAPKKAIFADLNPYVIDLYNAIKEGKVTSTKVKKYLEEEGKKLQEGDSEYYYIVRERFNKTHEPLDFLFLNRSCFNGMIRFNKNNKFNVPYGHKPNRFSKAYVTKITNQVKKLEELMKGKDWTFSCKSFEELLKDIPKNSFIYADPPYIGRHVDYFDSWDEADEKKLYDCLTKSKCNFMLSTWDYNEYRSNIYIDKIWKDCNKINIEHFYHLGAKENNRKPMMEALLTNYNIKDSSTKRSSKMKEVVQLTLLEKDDK